MRREEKGMVTRKCEVKSDSCNLERKISFFEVCGIIPNRKIVRKRHM